MRRLLAITIAIGVLACGKRPNPPPTVQTASPVAVSTCDPPAKCPAPPIDPNATVKLSRTECYGTCPSYEVTLTATGRVEWLGRRFVDVEGAASARIPPEKARELFELIATSCFFEMKSEYTYPVTDNPSADVRLDLAGRSKTIHHYAPSFDPSDVPAGFCIAPRALRTIEERIDEVCGTKKWIGAGGKKPAP